MNQRAYLSTVAATLALSVFTLLTFTGCYVPETKHAVKKSKDRPETVLISYHVKPGMEKPFETLLARAWQDYRNENLVLAQPHVLVREAEENNTIGYIEVFTWVNHAAPEKAPDSVKKIWAEEQSLCEPRVGRLGIGGGEVDLLVPK
jgi:hypothetical protein